MLQLNCSQAFDSGSKTQGAESCDSNRALKCQRLLTFQCDSLLVRHLQADTKSGSSNQFPPEGKIKSSA